MTSAYASLSLISRDGWQLHWLLGISRLIKITKGYEDCEETAGEKGHSRKEKLSLREGAFLYRGFIFSSDYIYLYTVVWKKGIWNELQSQGRKFKKREHSGIALQNLKPHTVKTDVTVQTGTEVNNTYLFPRIIPFEDCPPHLHFLLL